MRYRLELSAQAKRTLSSLPDRLRAEASEILLDLREEPRPGDSLPLRRDLAGYRRIRFNDWRIIYRINEADRVILVLRITRRSANTYLNL